MMHMILDFGRDVQFVFESWYAKQDDAIGYLYLGLILTVLYCFAHMFLPRLELFIKQSLRRRNSPLIVIKFCLACYQFLYQLSNIMIMMLMMTMNFWTGLAIALGCSLGYSFNGANKEWKQASIKYGQDCQYNSTISETLHKKF